jgi:hypothetical protein
MRRAASSPTIHRDYGVYGHIFPPDLLGVDQKKGFGFCSNGFLIPIEGGLGRDDDVTECHDLGNVRTACPFRPECKSKLQFILGDRQAG